MAKSTIVFRRGSASTNPILKEAEPGYSDGVTKIGDGSTRWDDLPHLLTSIDEPSPSDLAEHVASALPHPIYDDGPSLALLYENAKV